MFCGRVDGMHRLFGPHHAVKRHSRLRLKWLLQQRINQGRWGTNHNARVERAFALTMQHEHAELGLADAHGIRQDRCKHCLKVTWR